MSMSKPYFGEGGPAVRASMARTRAGGSAGTAGGGARSEARTSGATGDGRRSATPAARPVAPQTAPATATPTETRSTAITRYGLAAVRLLIGFEFLWAFADKTFGWGMATPAERAWVNGGSPTTGYLSGVEGPASGTFNAMAGNVFLDWLFMAGLLGIGLALILGVGMRIAAAAGALLLLLMWVASWPIGVNPFVDYHLVDAIVLVVLAAALAGNTLGLGRWWGERSFVKRYPVLR